MIHRCIRRTEATVFRFRNTETGAATKVALGSFYRRFANANASAFYLIHVVDGLLLQRKPGRCFLSHNKVFDVVKWFLKRL
jgi:hypothetical protein